MASHLLPRPTTGPAQHRSLNGVMGFAGAVQAGAFIQDGAGHVSSFSADLYASESRCASFAMRVKSLRKKATRAARAGSGEVRSIRVFPVASLPKLATQAGASAESGGQRVGAHLEGRQVFTHHAFTFVPSRPVHQLVQGLDFFMEAPMLQIEIPLLQRIEGPAVVPRSALSLAGSYRQAVRACWTLRRAKSMALTDLAREFGFNRQHVSDYLNGDDAATRRSLPAERIALFEEVCGNTFITQWLAARQCLTVLEEMQADRNAA